MKYFLIVLTFLSITSCADSVSFQEATKIEPVGFLHGLWHGCIAPFSFIISLFDNTVSVYAIYNNGTWYDFGFLLGAGILFKGSSVEK